MGHLQRRGEWEGDVRREGVEGRITVRDVRQMEDQNDGFREDCWEGGRGGEGPMYSLVPLRMRPLGEWFNSS